VQENHPDISRVKLLFNRWRSEKRYDREPIPEQLWKAAIKLCASHSIGVVCQELGVDRQKLRSRLNPTDSLSRRRGRPKKSRSFVTVPLAPNSSQGSSLGALVNGEVACEWVRPLDGARLRMNITRGEVTAVVQSFLGGGE
jgi:hypothetical protein